MWVRSRALTREGYNMGQEVLRVTERRGWDEDIVKNLKMITTIKDDYCYL
jgi:hypothetical protein